MTPLTPLRQPLQLGGYLQTSASKCCTRLTPPRDKGRSRLLDPLPRSRSKSHSLSHATKQAPTKTDPTVMTNTMTLTTTHAAWVQLIHHEHPTQRVCGMQIILTPFGQTIPPRTGFAHCVTIQSPGKPRLSFDCTHSRRHQGRNAGVPSREPAVSTSRRMRLHCSECNAGHRIDIGLLLVRLANPLRIAPKYFSTITVAYPPGHAHRVLVSETRLCLY